VGRLTIAEQIAAMRTPEQLYELLDPDVMWYSTEVDSNFTCNDRDDVVACIERNIAWGLTGRFDVLGVRDDFVVVQPVLDPPRAHTFSLLLRVRDDAIVEMRDFDSPAAAFRYAGIEPTPAVL
jgi:hypothetical protein